MVETLLAAGADKEEGDKVSGGGIIDAGIPDPHSLT